MTLSTAEIHQVYRRLRFEKARRTLELQRLEQKRHALFQQGANAASEVLRRGYARQVLALDAQIAGQGRLLALVEKQSQLVGHIIYAQEAADRLEQGLLAGVDWTALLAAVEHSRAETQARLERLNALLALLNPPGAESHPAARPPIPEVAVVQHVPDGDGARLADRRRVRYIGIDAPEMGGRDVTPEPWAAEAKEFNRRLVEGKTVRLLRDTSETDRYGRLLRYVYVGDTFVNAELVKAGLAGVLTLPPNTRHAALFETLEAEARRARRGMWKDDGG